MLPQSHRTVATVNRLNAVQEERREMQGLCSFLATETVASDDFVPVTWGKYSTSSVQQQRIKILNMCEDVSEEGEERKRMRNRGQERMHPHDVLPAPFSRDVPQR